MVSARREDDDDDFWPFDSLGEAAGSDELPSAPPDPADEPPAYAPPAADPITDPLPRRPVSADGGPHPAAAPVYLPPSAAVLLPTSQPGPVAAASPDPSPPVDVDRPIRRPPPRRRVATAPRARSIAPKPPRKRPPLAAVRQRRELGEHRRLFDIALVLLALVVAVLVVLALQG